MWLCIKFKILIFKFHSVSGRTIDAGNETNLSWMTLTLLLIFLTISAWWNFRLYRNLHYRFLMWFSTQRPTISSIYTKTVSSVISEIFEKTRFGFSILRLVFIRSTSAKLSIRKTNTCQIFFPKTFQLYLCQIASKLRNSLTLFNYIYVKFHQNNIIHWYIH